MGIISSLGMRKLALREDRYLIQGHTAGTRWHHDLKPSVSEASVLPLRQTVSPRGPGQISGAAQSVPLAWPSSVLA